MTATGVLQICGREWRRAGWTLRSGCAGPPRARPHTRRNGAHGRAGDCLAAQHRSESQSSGRRPIPLCSAIAALATVEQSGIILFSFRAEPLLRLLRLERRRATAKWRMTFDVRVIGVKGGQFFFGHEFVPRLDWIRHGQRLSGLKVKRNNLLRLNRN